MGTRIVLCIIATFANCKTVTRGWGWEGTTENPSRGDMAKLQPITVGIHKTLVARLTSRCYGGG